MAENYFPYQQLAIINPSPIVSLNGIVAGSYVYGCEVALEELELLSRTAKLSDYNYWIVAADFYNRMGRSGKARTAYKNALALASNPHDQKFLEKKLLELAAVRH